MRVAQSDNEYKDYYIATTLAMIYILYIVIQHIFHILSSNIYYLLQPPWRVGSDGAHNRVGQSWHCKQLASLQSPEEVQSFRYVSNILDADWMQCRKGPKSLVKYWMLGVGSAT